MKKTRSKKSRDTVPLKMWLFYVETLLDNLPSSVYQEAFLIILVTF